MVQIFDLPRSRSGVLGEAFGKGLSKVGENIGMQQKQSQLAKALFGEDGEQYAGLPIDQQLKLAKMQQDKQLEEASLQQKTEQQQQKNQLLQSLLGGGEPEGSSMGGGQGVPGEQPMQAMGGDRTGQSPPRRKKFSQQDLIKLSLIDPQTARLIQGEQEQDEKRQDKLQSETRKETLPFKQKVIESANSAREAIQNKEQLLRLIDTENLNNPTFAAAMEALPFKLGERFLSPETAEYRAGLIDEYKDLKTIFTGQTRTAELDILGKKIAGIYLNDTQKKAIIKSRIDALQAPLAKEEAAEEVERTMPGLGMFQWNKEVNKLAKQKTQSIFNKFLDEQNFIIGQAEKRQKNGVPLDKTNPDDRGIILQILKQADGDFKKAEKIAQQQGYKF